MDSQNADDLFEIEIDTFNENEIGKLPISLFEEIEADLCDRLMHSSNPEGDETDGPLDFIQNIVDNVKLESEKLIEDGHKKKFFKMLSKIFTILLSVKADSSEKIIKIVKLTISTVQKLKLVPKRKVRIRQWPPKEPYVKFKIKTLLPEQKTIQVKKNWQVI